MVYLDFLRAPFAVTWYHISLQLHCLLEPLPNYMWATKLQFLFNKEGSQQLTST